MSLTSRDLWFITPLQAAGIILNAANMGGSALQSPLVMPMFQLKDVSAVAAGAQLTFLLTKSEFFFPPTNALAMLSNLVVGITAYVQRDSDAAARAKLPYAAAGFVLNALVTAYALNIMVPINGKIKTAAKTLQVNSSDEKAAKVIYDLLPVWQTWNYGRATLMLAATVVGTLGLLEDGAAAKIPKL